MRALFLVFVLLGSTLVFADRLTTVSGDRVSGELIDLVNGKLTFKSPVIGTFKLDWSQVASLETDGEVRLTTEDGREFAARILSGGPGGLYVQVGNAQEYVSWLTLRGLNLPAPQPIPTKWEGGFSSSFGLTQSNRDAQNFNLDLDVSRKRSSDRLTAKAAYAFSSQSLSGGGNETTVDSWYTRGQYDVVASDRFYWYGSMRFDRDRVSGLDLRTVVGAGGGYTMWDRETSQFRTSFGLSYLREDFTVGQANSIVSLQFGSGLRHDVNSWLSVLHDLSYYPNPKKFSDYFLSSELILRSALASDLFAELKFVFDYDATPAPGAQRENYRYTMGVGLRF